MDPTHSQSQLDVGTAVNHESQKLIRSIYQYNNTKTKREGSTHHVKVWKTLKLLINIQKKPLCGQVVKTSKIFTLQNRK